MAEIFRTNSDNPYFRQLVALLDGDLTGRYGELQKHYSKFNRIDFLDTVVLVYENGVPAGCGCFRPFAPDTVEIKRMFVRPEFRGRGLSRLILQELEKWAAELGYAKSVLETGNRQAEAIQLYLHSGYTRIPNYGNYEGNENSICMTKSLI